jgi:gluconolactonase
MTAVNRGATSLVLGVAAAYLMHAAAAAQNAPAAPPPPQTAIDGVIAAGTKVELVKDGFQGVEGPVTAPDGRIFFSDIPANLTYVIEKNGEIKPWREDTHGTNGNFITKDGQLLGAEMNGRRLISVSLKDKTVTPLVTEFDGKPLRAPNDVIADKKGGVYFTDPIVGSQPPPPPNSGPARTLYRRPNGQVIQIDDMQNFPNGLTLTLDEKTLIINDFNGESLWAYDIQADGSVKNRREFAKLLECERTPQGTVRSRADGMAVDSKGRIYTTSAAGIQVISPKGEVLGIIRLPNGGRNMTFGGPGRHTMYITAVKALYKVQLLSEGPQNRAK